MIEDESAYSLFYTCFTGTFVTIGTKDYKQVNILAKFEALSDLLSFIPSYPVSQKLLLIYLGVFSAEDTVNYPSAWDLCCNGNWDESCAMIRIDCRKSNELAKNNYFYLAYF